MGFPAVVAVAALGAGVYLAFKDDGAGGVDQSVPRGIRNNNPGNIRKTRDQWRGAADDQSADADFVVFTSPIWGIRAMARTLKNYRDKYGLTTPREIIRRWAPPVENLTASYVNSVSRALDIDPDQHFMDSPENRMALVKAIIKHENGVQPYPDHVIEDGIWRAYT